MTGAERRERITAEIMARTGITEAMIERLVRGFYAKVRSDAVLAPIFEARIEDWEPHLQQMCAFWSSVALMSGRYHGTPMVKHMPLPVDAGHFDRWLELFEADRRARSVRRGGSAFRRTGAADRGQPRTRHRRRAGRHARNRRKISAQRGRSGPMTNRTRVVTDKEAGQSLFRQQPGADAGRGLVLTLAGMIAALALS